MNDLLRHCTPPEDAIQVRQFMQGHCLLHMKEQTATYAALAFWATGWLSALQASQPVNVHRLNPHLCHRSAAVDACVVETSYTLHCHHCASTTQFLIVHSIDDNDLQVQPGTQVSVIITSHKPCICTYANPTIYTHPPCCSHCIGSALKAMHTKPFCTQKVKHMYSCRWVHVSLSCSGSVSAC